MSIRAAGGRRQRERPQQLPGSSCRRRRMLDARYAQFGVFLAHGHGVAAAAAVVALQPPAVEGEGVFACSRLQLPERREVEQRAVSLRKTWMQAIGDQDRGRGHGDAAQQQGGTEHVAGTDRIKRIFEGLVKGSVERFKFQPCDTHRNKACLRGNVRCDLRLPGLNLFVKVAGGGGEYTAVIIRCENLNRALGALEPGVRDGGQ